MDFSNDSNILNLSKLETYYYVYTKLLGFDEKISKNSDGEISSLISNVKNKNLTRQLAEALESAGIYCAIVGAKKEAKNFNKNRHSKGGTHDALMVIIDDMSYPVSGIFYAEPMLDTKSKKTCTICNSLFKLIGAEELLSKGGKYEIEDMTLEALKNESEMLLKHKLAFAGFDFEEIKAEFSSDKKFKDRIIDIIEKLTDNVFEMKAKDKSVNKYIHPYFGEGEKLYSEAVNKTFIEVFDSVFKVACARKLNNMLFDFKVKNYEEFEKYFEDAENELKSSKMMIKIFSENYQGITPTVFKDVMLEAIEDGYFFAEDSNCYKYYKYVSNLETLLYNNKILKELINSGVGMIPNLEVVEEALSAALLAQGKTKEQVRKLVKEIMFGSAVYAGTSWNLNVKDIENISPFGENLANAQKSKY